MSSIAQESDLSSIEVARLKVGLLAEGLRLGPEVLDPLHQHSKPILRVRSGASGGLDLVLPGDIYVNCPVHERFAAGSPYVLGHEDGKFVVSDGRGLRVVVQVAQRPAYYDSQSRSGMLLSRIGQMCGDRLGIGVTGRCYYWMSRERRCRFCSIGLNQSAEQREKSLDDILDVVEAAYSDPVAPARHLLLGGGTPEGPDAGVMRIAEAASAIKRRWDRPIYAMIVPPEELRYIDILKDSGVDELGMNIEVFDERVARKIIPGKSQLIGLQGYRRSLERCVRVFGPINARSIMVVGLEDVDSTLRGVEFLASMGVMPILSPFRAIAGTDLESYPPPSAEMLWEVCVAATEVVEQYGLPLGPTCIPCQGNTLNLPGDPRYRFY